MLDTFLGIGASFDWISPLAAVLGDVMNGPSYTFLIPYGSSPLNGREIAWILRKRGVKTWGHMVISGTLTVSVRLKQARWAQYQLEQAGVPIENPLPGQSRSPSRGRGRSPRTGDRSARTRKRPSSVGGVADSISKVLNTRVF